ncbi:MAG TPA: NAD(P)/FAD-dependent oxidoreductase [Gammaproteobacteria bacterium]|nr:NAD(P)/FAD-dependent oxidoreductase [Gammaproteobacteria bacterium]
MTASNSTARPRVVIVGAGFGGLFAARGLRHVGADITLVDRQNYHLFQPLLYQVATAGLAPSDIAWPIRGILSRQKNVSVLLDEVQDVDPAAREVVTQTRHIPYDYLVLATGARHAYFGHPDWEAHAPGLKSIDDAVIIRHRVLMAFEQAEMTSDEEQRRRLLNFVVVGAGPTGVELAGTLAELARFTLAADFRHIDSRSARVILIEAGPRVLPAMPKSLSDYAEKSLADLGVEVRLGRAVTDCDAQGVMLDGERLPAATILWAAGVSASRAGEWLGVDTDAAGRVEVADDLSVPGFPNLFVIGDTAAVADPRGEPVPGIAPAAKQQGRYVARLIAARIAGRTGPAEFRYRHAGNLATIGRKSAVIDLPMLRLSGRFAWWLWGFAHIYFLIGMRSPVLVALNWLRQYLTYGRGARLITGQGSGGRDPD